MQVSQIAHQMMLLFYWLTDHFYSFPCLFHAALVNNKYITLAFLSSLYARKYSI